ncbi:MAG: ribonuclease Z [Bacteroidia bacterium]|nr:ribonuclease Z [Bacteroidia bacterium]
MPLGTSSAVSAYGRKLAGQLINHHDRYFLVDCGEGTQFSLQKYKIRTRRLDAIFISHLHADHFLGLPGLLSTLSLTGHQNPIEIFGPPGLFEVLTFLFQVSQTLMNYPITVYEISGQLPVCIFENNSISVFTFPLKHRIPCFGFLFQEKPKKKKFLHQLATADGIPKEYFHLLKMGTNIELLTGETITAERYLGKADPSYSYAYCSDTAFYPEIAETLQGVNLLYHEATFTEESIQRAIETYHSTARQAAEIAKLCQAKKLLLGHFSARYETTEQHLTEAKSVFENTEIAIEGKKYVISEPI